jgi:hypothetical protein
MSATWRLLPINAACELIAGPLWSDYASAKAVDPGRYIVRFSGMTTDSELRRGRYEEAKATLDIWLRGCLERGEYELWARRNDRLAKSEPVTPSAVCALEFDYEQRTAVGDGLPPLYDLQIRLPPVAPIKRWRKPPPTDKLEAAALAVAKTYQPDDPPIQAQWWKALKAHLPEVTRKAALNALRDWAPHLLRRRGQKPNRRS